MYRRKKVLFGKVQDSCRYEKGRRKTPKELKGQRKNVQLSLSKGKVRFFKGKRNPLEDGCHVFRSSFLLDFLVFY